MNLINFYRTRHLKSLNFVSRAILNDTRSVSHPAMDARLLSALILAVCYGWPSAIAHEDPEVHYDSVCILHAIIVP